MATIRAEGVGTLRRARGLSQRALADAAGVSRQAIGAIEGGRVQPSVAIALSIARALGTSVEAAFAPPGDLPPKPRRIAYATIRGRLVSHRLDREHLAIEPAESSARTVFVAGCDLAAGLLARHATARSRDVRVLWIPMTNRAALDALARGTIHAAMVHDTAVRRRQAGDDHCVCFDVATTEEGWLVERGNPLRLRGASDVVRASARVVNRPRGAGARALLDEQLRRAPNDPRSVSGYGHEVAGQLDAGRAVAQGFADAAVGMASVACVCALDFIALREERCSLLVRSDEVHGADARALLDALRCTQYARDLEAFGSYDVSKTGEKIA